MITLTNDAFTAEINELGAEVTQITRKQDGRAFIWNDTTGKYWGRHAPLLFPAIGKSNDDAYLIDGQRYPMGQHGFARDFTFDHIDQTAPDAVTMTLHANDQTLAKYPFLFVLTVTYQLTATGLNVTYTVADDGASAMPFALGFHPGFNIDAPLEEYRLQLVGATTPLQHLGVGPAPFRDGTTRTLTAATGDTIPLSHALLDDGLVILDAHTATQARLLHGDDQIVSLDVTDFPYVTLWSPEHKQAPFICVEPFFGLPDQAGKPGDWFEKAGKTTLKAGTKQTLNLTLTLG
ncbi:aldose 1-epimerase family protein [Lacticaseibacillus baoqingensis]|uniref:Aldose 1-epimerase family protein n=1 Tax=Lacticaseibacillus baoqingensis TaxID=2486013 RepID=A0ABW4ECI3_9LACO|nr:aldose 1-epimerase family protein [Lacticaseibacillus baoqingensis]